LPLVQGKESVVFADACAGAVGGGGLGIVSPAAAAIASAYERPAIAAFLAMSAVAVFSLVGGGATAVARTLRHVAGARNAANKQIKSCTRLQTRSRQCRIADLARAKT
jgi:hypothetical protein